MSRFGMTTWAAIVAASVVTVVLRFPLSLWAMFGVWAVYLPICALGVGFIRLNFYCRAICRSSIGRMRVALTFDDGPDPNVTPQVLDLLKDEKIEAAFFCVGKNVDANPELTARIAREGHLLANHTYRHPWFICMLWARRLTAELSRAQEAIERVTGAKPKLMRPPNGMTSLHFPAALKTLGLTMVGWNVRSLDTMVSAQHAVNRINRLTRDGSIILLHDGGMDPAKIVEIVRSTINNLRAKGFQFERLDRLIAMPMMDNPARVMKSEAESSTQSPATVGK
jgi:peptidoglycan-N-acetylglucosamine deacetylase